MNMLDASKNAKLLGFVGLFAAALLVSACQNNKAALDADPLATASTGRPSFTKTDDLSKQWKADPTNVGVAIAYSDSLGQLEQKAQQIEVLQTTASQTRGDAAAQSKLGRMLLAAGQAPSAEEALSRAAQMNPRDPLALSALGAALDQQTKHAEAREKYKAAMAIAPNDVGIMNNLAMSYSLQGKLPEAEGILRKAMAHPNSKAMPRVRQNLALVVGLQGRFDEAKQIASEDLPPDQVQANMAYLQQMLGRQNTWAQLKEG